MSAVSFGGVVGGMNLRKGMHSGGGRGGLPESDQPAQFPQDGGAQDTGLSVQKPGKSWADGDNLAT